jgi:hypothetical protein
MRMPAVRGVIRRRLLINFRVDPAVVQRHLPAPFRPKLQAGYAVGGICLIRLEHLRPKGIPGMFGVASENAAHRFAVTWDDASGEHEGVYIPRRDSGSLMNYLAGGRLFPGEHHRASFEITDDGEHVAIDMRSSDAAVSVQVDARTVPELPPGSIFESLQEASAFFEPGALGYSATSGGKRLDGMFLQTHKWDVQPLCVESVHSSYFAEESLFPAGSVRFDCGLIMRNIEHEWHSATEMYV